MTLGFLPFDSFLSPWCFPFKIGIVIVITLISDLGKLIRIRVLINRCHTAALLESSLCDVSILAPSMLSI